MTIIRINKKIIVSSGIILMSLMFFISTIMPQEYRSDIGLIIIQKQEDKVDAFAATKSAEYLSEILSRAVYTDSFIDNVLSSDQLKGKFSSNREDRKKEWQKAVKVDKINNTGIIQISVYDDSRNYVKLLSERIAEVFVKDNSKYHGGNEKIGVNIIDGPTVTTNPARPNIWINSFFGLIVGIFGYIAYLYFFKK